MAGKNKVIQDASRLFSLAEAEKHFDISAAELHEIACKGNIELCVLLPDDCDVYNAEPTSLQVDNPAYLAPLASFSKVRPSPFDAMPFRTHIPVKALVLSPLACRQLTPDTGDRHGFTAWQSLFSHGYALSEPGAKGKHAQYIKVLPESAKELIPGTVEPAERWCLVVYPKGQQFLRIPRHLDTQPTIIWTLVPCSLGHLIHVHLDRQSERSDAGLHC